MEDAGNHGAVAECCVLSSVNHRGRMLIEHRRCVLVQHRNRMLIDVDRLSIASTAICRWNPRFADSVISDPPG